MNFKLILLIIFGTLITRCLSPSDSEEIISILGKWEGTVKFADGNTNEFIFEFEEKNIIHFIQEIIDYNAIAEGTGKYQNINRNLMIFDIQEVLVNDKMQGSFKDTIVFWLSENKLDLAFSANSFIQVSGDKNKILNSSFYYKLYDDTYEFFNHFLYFFKQDSVEIFFKNSENEDFPSSWDNSYIFDYTYNEREITINYQEYKDHLTYLFTLGKLYIGSQLINLKKVRDN